MGECDRTAALIVALRDGLDAGQRAHVEGCTICAQRLAGAAFADAGLGFGPAELEVEAALAQFGLASLEEARAVERLLPSHEPEAVEVVTPAIAPVSARRSRDAGRWRAGFAVVLTAGLGLFVWSALDEAQPVSVPVGVTPAAVAPPARTPAAPTLAPVAAAPAGAAPAAAPTAPTPAAAAKPTAKPTAKPKARPARAKRTARRARPARSPSKRDEVDDLLGALDTGSRPTAARGAAPGLPSTLSRAQIMATVKAGAADVQACKSLGPTRGTIMIGMTVGTDGRVLSARVRTLAFRDTPVGDCVRTAALGLLFPAFQNGPMVLNMPWSLAD